MSDIFTDDELKADAVTADPVEIEQPETELSEVSRDDKGRFAPKTETEIPEGDQNVNDRGKSVPHSALHAERERRKQAEESARTAQAQLDQIAEWRKQNLARQQAPAEPAPADDDPGSQIAHLKQRLADLEGIQKQETTYRQTAEVEQHEARIIHQHVAHAEQEFASVTPDYWQAIDHLKQSRMSELQAYGLSEFEANQQLISEIQEIGRTAAQQGRSPAEIAYVAAKARGWSGQAQPQKQSGAQAQVEGIKAAMASSKSLGGAVGAAPAADLNATTVAGMSWDEFDRLYATPEGKRMIDALSGA